MPPPILSPYLLTHCSLWIWDFDDTIIRSDAYLHHKMDDYTIAQLSDSELLSDIPHCHYFHDVVAALYLKGVKIGIASFGVYNIILAYMYRIFGVTQKYFGPHNIKAFHMNRSIRDLYHSKLPRNKNQYIYDIMQFYRITSYTAVCLFDDAPSNIADASEIGIIAIQIDKQQLFNPNVMTNISDEHTLFQFRTAGTRKLFAAPPNAPAAIPIPTATTINTYSVPPVHESFTHDATASPFYNAGYYLNIAIFSGFVIALCIFIYIMHSSDARDIVLFWALIAAFIGLTLLLTTKYHRC